MSRNCTICGKPIKLTPTAAERAAKFGGTAAHYTSLFTEHSQCQLEKRKTDTSALMKRICENELASAEGRART